MKKFQNLCFHFLLLLAMLFFSPYLLASIDADYKAGVSNRLLQAKANGWTIIDGVPIDEILLKIQTVRVEENPPGIQLMIEGRTTATWTCDPRTHTHALRVNSAAYQAISSISVARDGIQCHELLGAACFDDSNFQKCLRLDIMTEVQRQSQEPDSFLFTRVTDHPVNHNILMANGGGSTGTSGGGDGIDFLAKQALFKYLTDVLDRLKTTASKNIFKTNFLDMNVVIYKFQRSDDPPRIECDGGKVSLTSGSKKFASMLSDKNTFGLILAAIVEQNHVTHRWRGICP